jgi:phospho-N-acetylmuramoyl-pentapeptide-transferase
MLLALANWVAADVRTFNVFGYITLRAVLATITALMISFVVGPRMIRKLAQYKIGQSVRDDGPQTHLTKAGTPTMGGALILVSIVITTLLWADLRNRFIWVVLLVTLGFGAIADGRLSQSRNGNPGSSARVKFFWQSVIGLLRPCIPLFRCRRHRPRNSCSLFAWLCGFNLDCAQGRFDRPVLQDRVYPFGVWGFIVLSYCVIVGSSNASIYRRADGLAIMRHGRARGHLRLRTGRADFRRIFPPHIQARASSRCSARRSPARAWASCGSTPIRPKCSWVTSARWPARHWAQLPSSCARRSSSRHGRRIRHRDPVGRHSGHFIQAYRQTRFRWRLHHHYEPKGWKKTGGGQVLDRHHALVLFGLTTLKLR